MGFELYSNKQKNHSNQDFISISKAGRIGFSGLCYDTHFKGAKFIELYFDEKEQLMAVKPSQNNTEHTFKLKTKGNNINAGRGIGLYNKGFFIRYGIAVEKAIRYTPAYDKKNEMLIIDLKKPL